MISKSNYSFYIGAIISQVFTLATSYFVLWKLSPEVYGEFSYFISISAIFASISTLKFEQSIAISENDLEVSNKFFLTVILGFGINIFMTLISFPFIEDFNYIHLILSILLSVGIILNASIQQLFLYYERHKYNALLTICIPAINFLLTIMLLVSNDGLIYAYVISYSLVTSIFFAFLLFSKFLIFTNYNSLKQTLLSNINYPKFVLPASLATIALTYLHPIFLKTIFSTKEVGLFAISNRFLLLPAIVISAVVSGLFRAKFSKLYFEKKIQNMIALYKNMLKFLAVVALFSFPILILILSQLHNFIKIDNWNELGIYSILLVGYGIAQFCISPILNIPLVLNKHKLLLWINLVQLLLLLLIYLSTWIFGLSILSFLLSLSIVFLGFTIALIIYAFKIIKL